MILRGSRNRTILSMVTFSQINALIALVLPRVVEEGLPGIQVAPTTAVEPWRGQRGRPVTVIDVVQLPYWTEVKAIKVGGSVLIIINKKEILINVSDIAR